jgi:uncharacterized membrane protein YhaH (DUF805 family)
VALPTEHGGWGLTAEPVLLGLLVAPSWAGAAIGAGAVLAFLARTPIKIALGDLRRRRVLSRTRVAGAVAAVELTLLLACTAVAISDATGPMFVPLVVVGPLLLVELVYDIKSRGRRLVPELAGSVGIAGVAAMIALASDAPAPVAVGLWLVLAGRAITSIPWVREQVRRLHHRGTSGRWLIVSDLTAIGCGLAAAAMEPQLIAGAAAVAVVVAAQRLNVLRPAPTAKVIGLRQTALGLLVVVATAIGVALTGGIT